MNFQPKWFKISYIFLFILFFGRHADAYNTVNLNAKNGIVSNAVYKIYIDKTHRIWLATNNGISCLTGNGIVNYGNNEGLTCSGIRNFVETSDGRFWISSDGKGVYELKNNRFINYQFKRSYNNNVCGQLREYKGWLFISSEEGLDGLNLNTNKFYRFPIPNQKKALQGERFFEWNNELYVQTFFNGAFRINLKTTSLDSVRYEEYINKWNFNVTQIKDTFFLCRSKYQKNLHHNLFYCLTPDYIRGGKMDSIEISTLIWKMTQTPLGLMAACWGARDDSGGLFLRKGKKMQNVNDLFGINSNKVRDIVYDATTMKFYVATLDKGLYIFDFNEVVWKSKIEQKGDILDLKIVGNKIFALKKDTLPLYENGKFVKNITRKNVEQYIGSHTPVNSLNEIGIDAPNRFLDLSISDTHLIINSNFTEIRLDLNLNIIDYIKSRSDGRACFLKNNDVLIFRAFGGASELCKNFGRGGHKRFIYWAQGKTNPKEVTNYCKLNDTTILMNGDNSMYIYQQTDTLYKRFDKLGTINFPTLIDRLGENTFVAIDRLNHLYKGIYTKDTLLFSPIAELHKWGVMECYFVRSFQGLIAVATNKGIFIFDKRKIRLVDKIYGLPDNVVVRTAEMYNNNLLLATSDGIYTIDLIRLRSIKTDYSLSNLNVLTDNFRSSFTLNELISFKSLPHEINVLWEINSHPYPGKLHYAYKLGIDGAWIDVSVAGKIRIIDPQYGNVPVYLRITDDTNGYEKVIRLVTLNIPKPFYLQAWFFILLGMIVMGVVYYSVSKRRIKILKQKANKAEMEAHELQLRLDTLQFLLKPHFIFNALSSVQNLMLKNEIDKSLEYTGYFAKFLRGIMQNSDNKLISLKEEIDNTLRYIELEKLRFNENVVVEVDIDEQLNPVETLIIPFLFQPFVENIFKHAFTKEITNPRIQFVIQKIGDKVVFTISDNGKGLNGQTYNELISKSTSKGLKIILAQLQKYFPDKHTLSVAENPTGGACWVIRVQFLISCSTSL